MAEALLDPILTKKEELAGDGTVIVANIVLRKI